MAEPPAAEKILASEGAKRLAQDPILQGALDLLVADATSQAVFHNDPTEREQSRQLVLAIAKLRGALEVAATYSEQRLADAANARSFE